jgi:hypothetical protein
MQRQGHTTINQQIAAIATELAFVAAAAATAAAVAAAVAKAAMAAAQTVAAATGAPKIYIKKRRILIRLSKLKTGSCSFGGKKNR